MCYVTVMIEGGSIPRISRMINIPEGTGIRLVSGMDALMMLAITGLRAEWTEDGQSEVIMTEITRVVPVLWDLYVLVSTFIRPQSCANSEWHLGLTSIVGTPN
jgi:hypothetical protein